MVKNDNRPKQLEIKQASNSIALVSIVGLTLCFVAALYKEAQVPIFLYAIFGGGILGTENVLKFIKAIFRIDSKKDG